MAKGDTKDLIRCLKPFPSAVKEKALWIRDLIWDTYPDANELIYDNYNAVAVGWSPTDRVGHTFCTFALGRTSHNVHFGFYWGSKLHDPKKLLIGEGNQYRYILVGERKDFPETYIRKLMAEAFSNSLAMVKDPKQLVKGKTIFKSESAKKRTKAGKPAAKKKSGRKK